MVNYEATEAIYSALHCTDRRSRYAVHSTVPPALYSGGMLLAMYSINRFSGTRVPRIYLYAFGRCWQSMYPSTANSLRQYPHRYKLGLVWLALAGTGWHWLGLALETGLRCGKAKHRQDWNPRQRTHPPSPSLSLSCCYYHHLDCTPPSPQPPSSTLDDHILLSGRLDSLTTSPLHSAPRLDDAQLQRPRPSNPRALILRLAVFEICEASRCERFLTTSARRQFRCDSIRLRRQHDRGWQLGATLTSNLFCLDTGGFLAFEAAASHGRKKL